MCVDCIEKAAQKRLSDLTATELAQFKEPFVGATCPKCGGSNSKKICGMESAYVRGYGYADKAGVKRDMDIHAMSMGRDPYAEHRKVGERREVIGKLQKAREPNKHSKTIRFAK